MARYTYNASLVSQTIETLNDACKALDQTNVDIQKGIDMICNAHGAENININFSPITGYQSQVIDFIDAMNAELIKKSEEIEEYENAPWWKKLFATIGMGALKIIEGFIGVNENVIDGLVAIVGFIGGIFNSEFQECLGEFIKKDWVGDTTAQWYEEGWLKGINKYSYMSHESTAANILKGVGNAVGYVALSCIPYVGFAVSTAAATMGAIGSGTQSGLQQGMSYNQAFGQGAKQGAIALATSLITKGIANKLTGAGSAVTNSLDDVSKAASNAKNTFTGLKAALANGGDEIAGLLDDAAGALDDVAGFADDALITGGTTAQSANAAFNSAKNLTTTLDKLKTAAQAAGYSDDIINSIDDMAKAASTTQTAANTAKNLIANTSTITNGKLGDTASNAVSKAKDVITKVPGVEKTINTVKTIASSPTAQKVASAVTSTAQKVASASPVVTSAVSTTAGVVAFGTLGDNATSSAYRQFVQESATVTPGEGLYNATSDTTELKSTAATAEEAAANLQNLEAQGYTPGSTSTETTSSSTEQVQTSTETTSTNTSSPSSTTSTATSTSSETTSGYKQTTITTDSVTLPDYPSSTKTESTPTTNPSGTTSNPTTDQVVSGIDLVNPTPGGTGGTSTTTTNINTVTGGTNIEGTTTQAVSSEVLNTFGDVSSAISGISSTKQNIPTSSSPILSSSSESSSSFIPLGAGLGAASLAGISTKAIMDKKEKKEDEDLETEEWIEQDDVEIDYNTDIEEENDYLNPTDELAFQE